MAKNTGRGSRIAQQYSGRNQFMRSKTVGGSFGKHKTPWKCRWGMHNWSDWTSGANYKVCYRCKVISNSQY